MKLDHIDLAQLPSPIFLLNKEKLIQNLQVLDMVQKASGAKIILALKGFAMFSAFHLVKKYLPGCTASSLNEAKLAKEYFGGEVHAYSPAYPPTEFPGILDICQHITFNSLGQYGYFEEQLARRTVKPSIGLRINPGWAAVETDLYNPCIRGSRLGIIADQLGENLPAGVSGLHFHSLCENSAEVLERTLEEVESRYGHLLHQAQWLNMGGGHAITRKGYDLELLISLIQNLKQNYDLEVILEPGSAVGWETGWLASTVLDIVESDGIKTAMLDTSFSAHMPDCIEMPYKPRVLSATEEPTDHRYNLGGATCLAGDFIADFRFEQPLQIGDTIVFDDMMHYTMVKTTTFNGVNLPAIGILHSDGHVEVVREYGYESYKDRLS